jgi:hypothetical protein
MNEQSKDFDKYVDISAYTNMEVSHKHDTDNKHYHPRLPQLTKTSEFRSVIDKGLGPLRDEAI